MLLQRSRTPQPRAARSSNSARSQKLGDSRVAFESMAGPASDRTRPRGGGLSKRSSPESLWLVVRAENPSRQKLGDSQCRPGGDRRADCRSLEPRRFGRAQRERLAQNSRPEMAPQRLEKIKSAPGNGMASEASNPQHLVRGRAAGRARLRLTSLENDKDSGFGKLQKKGKRGKSPGGREIVAALAERGRRRAPHFLKCRPSGTNAVSDRVYNSAWTFAPLTKKVLSSEIARCRTEIGACARHLLRARRRAAAQRTGRGGHGHDKKVARVGEAMIVAHSMMMQGDLQAMDRLLELNGELDRYHWPPRPSRRAPSRPVAARVAGGEFGGRPRERKIYLPAKP